MFRLVINYFYLLYHQNTNVRTGLDGDIFVYSSMRKREKINNLIEEKFDLVIYFFTGVYHQTIKNKLVFDGVKY